MTQVAYDVEVIVQEQNPGDLLGRKLRAMVKGFRNEDEHRCREILPGASIRRIVALRT